MTDQDSCSFTPVELNGTSGDVTGECMDTKWINDRLRRRQKTISDLAVAAERDRSAMSRIVNGKQPLSLTMAPIIAEELGVGVLELVSRAGIPGIHPMSSAPIIPWHMAGALAEAREETPFRRQARSVDVPVDSQTLVALEVSDITMSRVAPPGSIIVIDYSRKTLPNHALGLFVGAGSQVLFARWNTDARGAWITHDSHDQRYAQSAVDTGGRAPLVIGAVVSVPILTTP